jgi:O-succinylbenzoate-CoA ligase
MRNTIGEILATRAFADPEAEALVDVASGVRLTFAELDERVNQTVRAYRDLGVAKGDRVALLMMNSAGYLEAYFAAARLGAVTVLLNWRLSPAELRYIVADSGASMLVFDEEFSEAAAQMHDIRDTHVDRWLYVGEDARRPRFAIGFEEARTDARAALGTVDVEEDDVLYLMYTSGTTGRPKGVMHTHGTTFWAILNTAASMDYRFGDRYLNCMPLFHVGGLQPVNTCLYRRCTTVLMRAFESATVWEQIAAERVTSLMAVPAMLDLMADTFDATRHDRSSLRWLITAGSPVPVLLLERYVAMDVEILQGYGLTECGGPATVLTGADAVSHLGSAGKAFFHCDVRIAMPDGSDAPPGVAGEILIRSASNMVGYWNLPQATAEAMQNGWLHTGDVAEQDNDGYVVLRDRLKDMIISGGENIYPAEIEEVILTHPGIREVAVIGQASARWGESPCAVVVAGDPALEADDVLAWCEGRLARFKTPKTVQFVDELPRNPAGKPLKRLLRERFPGPAPQ